jgi:hypothetical protein
MAANGFCLSSSPSPTRCRHGAHGAEALPDAAGERPEPGQAVQPRSALHQWVREQFHVSVIAHEMGNPSASATTSGHWDALNYAPQYWQLRSRNNRRRLARIRPCPARTEPCSARAIDPITETEVNGLV